MDSLSQQLFFPRPDGIGPPSLVATFWSQLRCLLYPRNHCQKKRRTGNIVSVTKANEFDKGKEAEGIPRIAKGNVNIHNQSQLPRHFTLPRIDPKPTREGLLITRMIHGTLFTIE
ncbi:hypothetical protein NPIL_433311 [Nephila pilipes]|uniref:Uncharacterized protein n=1 Tax=Nephila pilipes TaxID=299642 RepID=A0A8X6PH25_NEPPI|nr:hypothetical protein NPIL_433311 [Nephila pilipes]